MKVRTPVEGFTGSSAGVEFVDGVGETDDPNALDYFRRHGYGVGSKAPVEPGGDLALQDAILAAAEEGEGDQKAAPTPAKKAPAKKAAPKKKADKPATTAK